MCLGPGSFLLRNCSPRNTRGHHELAYRRRHRRHLHRFLRPQPRHASPAHHQGPDHPGQSRGRAARRVGAVAGQPWGCPRRGPTLRPRHHRGDQHDHPEEGCQAGADHQRGLRGRAGTGPAADARHVFAVLQLGRTAGAARPGLRHFRAHVGAWNRKRPAEPVGTGRRRGRLPQGAGGRGHRLDAPCLPVPRPRDRGEGRDRTAGTRAVRLHLFRDLARRARIRAWHHGDPERLRPSPHCRLPRRAGGDSGRLRRSGTPPADQVERRPDAGAVGQAQLRVHAAVGHGIRGDGRQLAGPGRPG